MPRTQPNTPTNGQVAPKPTRGGRPRIHHEIERFVAEMSKLGLTAPEIQRLAKAHFPRSYPALRTVQRLVSPKDPSQPWRMLDAEAEEVGLVMPVVAALISISEGRRTEISQTEATAIIRVRSAAPTLEPYYAYFLAASYVSRDALGQSTEDLDLYLGLQPWRSPDHEASYERALDLSRLHAFYPSILASRAGDSLHQPDVEAAATEEGRTAIIRRRVAEKLRMTDDWKRQMKDESNG